MSRSDPYLVPQPRSIKFGRRGSRLNIGKDIAWAEGSKPEPADDFALELLRNTIAKAEAGGAASSAPLVIRLDPSPPSFSENAEAYRLAISTDGIAIQSSSARGRYYAVQTLRQLVNQYGRSLPCLTIDDWPAFRHRGFMHDVSRGKVPRLDTLFELVELLGFLKYNQLQLYIEHTFAFAKHPEIGEGHSPLTAEDIRALDAHCRKHHIELVPNLQSFGHAAHILDIPRYHPLAESDYRGGWTLSPMEPGTYELLKDFYEEFLPSFSHREFFNVGCDETYDLGKGKSAELATSIGLGRVYLGHLLKVRDLVQPYGRRMMFWGDIIAKYPDLVPEIPKDVVLLNWWYEAHGEEHGYRGRVKPAKEAGLEHWVCPGTSTWNSLFFRMENARVNLRAFAKAGVWGGASGCLVTDWGDNGHYNFLSYSLWPIAYGADCAWRPQEIEEAEKLFDRRFTLQLLGDIKGEWVKPLRLMGDLYQAFGVKIPNNSAERWLLTGNPEPRRDRLGVSGELKQYNAITPAGLNRALKKSEDAAALLREIESTSGEARAIRDEWLLGAELSAHACRRALWLNHGEGDPAQLKTEAEELRNRFEQLWLIRNRESDLDSNRYDFKQGIAGYEKERVAMSF